MKLLLTCAFDALRQITRGTKLLTLSECGGIPSPDAMYSTGDMWSWVMPWYGDYTSGGKDNDVTTFRPLMTNIRVITREEMPNLK